jgi:hypothetical protein
LTGSCHAIAVLLSHLRLNATCHSLGLPQSNSLGSVILSELVSLPLVKKSYKEAYAGDDLE